MDNASCGTRDVSRCPVERTSHSRVLSSLKVGTKAPAEGCGARRRLCGEAHRVGSHGSGNNDGQYPAAPARGPVPICQSFLTDRELEYFPNGGEAHCDEV